MPTQEPSLNIETMLPQLSHVNSFIHAVALLLLSGRMDESLWDVTNRVCESSLCPEDPFASSATLTPRSKFESRVFV